MKSTSTLSPYQRKRNFQLTKEPRGKTAKRESKVNAHPFFIQKHDSRRPHYDLRLEMAGTLKSWAVPKGLSDIPGEKRLAVQVEDHPLEYAKFEGEIQKGEYGAGHVSLWDKGIYSHDSEDDLLKALEDGHLDLQFERGSKVVGNFSLIRMHSKKGNQWLLIKKREPLKAKRHTQTRPMMTSGYVRSKPEGWIVHPRVQGHRVLIQRDKDSVQIFSRHGRQLKDRFDHIVAELIRLPFQGILDGEIAGETTSAILYLSDLLAKDGKSLCDKPLSYRLSQLRKIPWNGAHIKLIDQYQNDDGLMIAKNPDSPYIPGRSPEWKLLSTSKFNSQLALTNRDKIFFPKQRIRKGAMVEYYRSMAPILLPYLKDRPQSLHRHPDGLRGESFYQKDMKGYHPPFLETCRISSSRSGQTTEYALIQNEESLLYFIQLGCIEIHPWLSRIGHLDYPDFTLIDLDPDENPFSDVVMVALALHKILTKIGAPNYCKTSGATGVHIGIPLGARYTYESSVQFARAVCQVARTMFPQITSLERSPSKRRGLIYLDCLQNRRGQTVVAPYSLRPLDQAPVSMPLTWDELKRLKSPLKHHMLNTKPDKIRFQRTWGNVLGPAINLEKSVKQVEVIYGSKAR